ncbi:hypothetical protein ABT387_35940 [Streptomyces lydicus]|uniref:hypothetical protein n=1 Tax=Streptomyces lydicus TaxID=47763 RepID=UPI00332C4C6D
MGTSERPGGADWPGRGDGPGGGGRSGIFAGALAAYATRRVRIGAKATRWANRFLRSGASYRWAWYVRQVVVSRPAGGRPVEFPVRRGGAGA